MISGDIASTLKKGIQKYFGDFGLASVANIGIFFLTESKSRLAVVKVSHGPHKFLISILPILNKIGKELATYRVLYHSQTIMQCKKFLINHQNKKILDMIDKTERKDFINQLLKA